MVQRYYFGSYILDVGLYELRCGEQLTVLPTKEFDMLRYLISQRHRVVSRQELHEQVWPGLTVTDWALDQCLHAVRRAVGDSGETQHVIRNVRGRGYRFIAEVSEEAEPDVREEGAPPGTSLPPPLDSARAYQTVLQYLQAGQSVNLVAPYPSPWRGLLDQLQVPFPALCYVDLQDGEILDRRAFVTQLLAALGRPVAIPSEGPGEDLVLLSRSFSNGELVPVVLLHFEVVHTWPDADRDLRFFCALKFLVDVRRLLLLVHSARPLAAIGPPAVVTSPFILPYVVLQR